ncbi:hypothetical protein [Gracilimonas sediminicola]|uniref:hypothetical protein n=1 Tax=Gracilimonas sediminicola TaxID=2952158 RepID=UPI0038D4D9D3
MIPRIKNFTPPADSYPYNPSKKVTVPGNDSVVLSLKGRGANAFGFNRILPFGSDLSVIEASFTLNEDYNLIKADTPIQLSAIRQLFLRKSLLAPFIIQQNNELLVTLTNTSGTDQEVNIALLGYDTPALNKLIAAYDEKGIKRPTPVFLYAKGEVAADSANVSIPISTKSVDVEIVRAAIKTDDDPDMSVTLQYFNEAIKNQVFVQQFNDEYEDAYSIVPIRVGGNSPLRLLASNTDQANANTLSFIGEAYVIE